MAIYYADGVRATTVEIEGIPELNERDVEQIWCVVNHGNDKILVGCIYRPPNSDMVKTKRVIETLKAAKKAVKTIGCSAMCVYGDFNFPHIRYESLDVDGGTATLGYLVSETAGGKQQDALFLEELEEQHLQQLVTFPTFRNSDKEEAKNTLDLIISDDPSRIYAIESEAPLGRTPKGRHHVVLTWSIATNGVAKPPPSKPRFIWSTANWAGISESFSEVNWEERLKSLNPDECYEEFLKVYHSACTASIETTSAPIKPAEQETPWMDSTIRASINNKRAAYERYRASGKKSRHQLKKEYKAACKEMRLRLRLGIECFELDLVEQMSRNGKDFHAYVNRQQADPDRIHALKDTNNNLCTESKEIGRILNDGFHEVFTREPNDIPMPPFEKRAKKDLESSADELYNLKDVTDRLAALNSDKSMGPDGVHPRVLKECAASIAIPLTAIFKRSHKDGRAPTQFKRANITPIFKKGCRATASNYRPISLTSVPCKIQEGILHDAIFEHLNREGLLAPEQHGFLPKKSCVTNLLECYEIMCDAMAKGIPIDVIYLDFCKAFDIVPHMRLLHKLKAYGIGGKLLDWITDWLTTREQRVVFDGNESEWKKVLSGVPQGSVLGPLLFVIFINDLAESLHNKLRMYADDSKILGKAGSAEDRKRLQEDIDKCVEWSHTWLMKFNIAKCKVMHVGRGKKKSSQEYTMSNEQGTRKTLEITRVERDLGVLVSDNLKFGPQCKAAAAKAMWKFGVLKKVFSSRSRRLWTVLWKAHIRPHLEHAIQAWSPYLDKDIHVLERVQRRVTKHMDGMKGLSYEDRLHELNKECDQLRQSKWTTLEERRLRGDLIFTYQVYRQKELIDKADPELIKVTPFVNLDWRWAKPCVGPASSVRANNNIHVNPATFKNCDQRSHFLTSRVDAPLRALPASIMRKPTVNGFKNAYDKFAWGEEDEEVESAPPE